MWHKKGVEARRRTRKERPPLDQQRLEELAIRYVGRFATTRAKLRSYLARKVRERGWGGTPEPDLEALSSRFSDLGYVDDAAYALAKSRSLAGRGYGKRRLEQKLRADGVGDDDAAAARDHAEAEEVEAALRLAQRRRIGPFASSAADPLQREKWIAALVRGGHSFALARAISVLAPGAAVDTDMLRDQSR